MPYYPSSQVKTNLYTNGGEFVTKLGNVSYTGFYWKTSSGKYFSGKTPQDSNIIEIIIPPNSPGNDDPGPLVYGTSNTSIINSSLIYVFLSRYIHLVSNFKSQISNFKSQISNLKIQISNFKSQCFKSQIA